MSIYNREFERIDNEAKAYVLGLMYADGSIGEYNKRYQSHITLHKNDEYLLKKIVDIFPFFKLIRHTDNSVRIICSRKALYEDFLNHGLLQRKTYVGMNFPDIANPLINHFIRGFFDGDGSINIQKSNVFHTEMFCTSFDFSTKVLKVLYDNKIDFKIKCRFPDKDKKVSFPRGNFARKLNIYIVYGASYKSGKLFSNFIYKNATIYLDRKHSILTQDKIYNHDRTMYKCPECNQYKTSIAGYRSGKVRIKCSVCQRGYTVEPSVGVTLQSITG